MGESTSSSCLMRSISHPLFASCELKAGDPLRALTTSISFGRFLTEPLDWEKWSSFSHNRILEDVKKYSRPGAVAEKKAFFEAPVSISCNTRENEDICSPITGVILSKSDNVYDDMARICQADVTSPSTNVVFSEYSRVDDNVPTPSFSQIGQVEQEKRSTENTKAHINDAASDRQKKPEVSSVKSSSRNGTYKKLQNPQKTSSPSIRVKKDAKHVTEKTRSGFQSIHMSMNFSPAQNKIENSKIISKPSKESLNKVSLVNGVEKNSQVLPRSENKRSNTGVLKSVSTKNSEATSRLSTKKPKTATVPSSFCFRSEERAAKRKEFFQKLEEKSKKIQLQPKLKEKTRNDNKKLRCHTVLPTQCFSPILVRKPKNFIEINKKKLSSSMASLPTRKQ